jgi:cytochrome c oxidase subunit 2
MRKLPKIIAGLAVALLTAAPALAASGKSEKIISPTAAWNHTWDHILLDIWLIGIVFGGIAVYFLIRYRAKSPDQVGEPVKLTAAQMWAWALVPAALFMADDFLLSAKGWSLWNLQRTVPSNGLEIKVTGSQWRFDFDYGNGATSDDEMWIPVGEPVILRMTSNDVIHSFGLSEYRLKEDLIPGRITYMWLLADEVKDSPVTCQEFCGNSHSQMATIVRAVPKEQFAEWLAKHTKKISSNEPGKDAGKLADAVPGK